MSLAEPGVGECDICFELIPCVKLLDCGHSLCTKCAGKLLNQEKAKGMDNNILHLTCPNCRRVTECSGIDFLRTRYFGKVKCDICLGQKDTEDMWWCSECVMTVCSKCSIKEHAAKNHQIAEWNKLDPVHYSVNYIENIRMARQSSTASECNKRVIRAFLSKLEQKLINDLSLNPELEKLRTNLLSHYGTQFNMAKRQLEQAGQFHRSSSSPSGSGGSKVLAKVMQIAGQNVTETVIPTQMEAQFQVYFSITPEEAAKYLLAKVEFIPFEEDRRPSLRSDSCSAIMIPSKEAHPGIPPVMPTAPRAPSVDLGEGPGLKLDQEIVFETPQFPGKWGSVKLV